MKEVGQPSATNCGDQIFKVASSTSSSSSYNTCCRRLLGAHVNPDEADADGDCEDGGDTSDADDDALVAADADENPEELSSNVKLGIVTSIRAR